MRETFFSVEDAKASFPAIRNGFWINVKMFLIAEPLILVIGIAVAVARRYGLALADSGAGAGGGLHRPVARRTRPSLVVLCRPRRPGPQAHRGHHAACSGSPCALVLSYGAYVAEVVRAGIESIHPSQVASAEALGLARAQIDAVRRPAAGAAPGHAPAAQRLRVTSEGHRAGLGRRRDRGALRRPGLRQLQLQLHAPARGGGLLRGHHRAAGALHRLARALVLSAANGGGR